MAITVISTPNTMSIAYRPMVYEWSSNASDLQYCVIEIVDTLNSNTRIAAKSVQADLDDATSFSVNISDIIQDNIGFTPSTLGSSGVLISSKENGAFELIGLKVYEVTEDVNGLIVTTYDPDNDQNTNYDEFIGGAGSQSLLVNGYNWTESHFDYNGFNITDYQLTDDTKKFLSKAPSVKDIELGVNEFIGILYHAGVAIKNFKLKILTYDSSNSLLNTDFIDVNDWNSSYPYVPFNTYFSLGVGTENLIQSGISLTNVAYYTIQMVNDDGDKSELRRFNIVGGCDGDVRLHWSNKFGKQESYTFKGNKIESLDHKSQTYLKALGNTYASESRGFTVMQNISTSNFSVFTNSIGRDEYEFLATMLVNKNAWIEQGGSYYPIIIQDGTQLIRNEDNVPIQFDLVYAFANSTKGLRG